MAPPPDLVPHLLRILARPPYHPSSVHVIGLLLFPILKHQVQSDREIWPAFMKVHGEGAEIRIYGRVPGYAVDENVDVAALNSVHDAAARLSDDEASLDVEDDLWGLAIFTPGQYDRPYARSHIWLSSESSRIVPGPSSAPSPPLSKTVTSLFTHILKSFIVPSTLDLARGTLWFSSLNRCWIPIVREYVETELKGRGASIGRVGTATKVAKRVRATSRPSPISPSTSKLIRLPQGYVVRPPRTPDIPLILKHNALKFDREYMEGLIWSGCVVEDAAGEAVGWSLSHEDLSFCALHTIPSARKHGIGQTLIDTISTIQAAAIRASPYNPYALPPVFSRCGDEGTPASSPATMGKDDVDDEVWVHGDAEEYNQVVLGWFERQGFKRVVDNVWLSLDMGVEGGRSR